MKNSRKFDLKKFKKIEDIIFLDEPILTHLKLNNDDYFLYLVENKENSDVFLLFNVDNELIIKYLTKIISLQDLLLKNNFVFQIEQDFEGNVHDYDIIYTDVINPDYLPSSNSFIEYQPTENSFYFKELQKINLKPYLLDLRREAFYIKFKSLNQEYGDTLGLNELTNVFLKNLSSSFKNYLGIEFLKRFSEKFSQNESSQHLKSILHMADFRTVDFGFSSFEMGLSIDKVVNSKIGDVEVKQWVRTVGNEYKNSVLDENITDSEQELLIQRYTEEERQRIFKPIVAIADMIKVKNNPSDKYHDIGLKNKKVAAKLTSIDTSLKLLETDLGVIESTIAHKISNSGGRTKKKVISNQVLNNYDVKMFLNTIEPLNEKAIIFANDIEVAMHFDSTNGFKFTFDDLDVSESGLDYSIAFKNFNNILYKKIIEIISGDKESNNYYNIVKSFIANPDILL